MTFDTLSFSDLFHDGFSIEGNQLLLHAAMRNELRRYVESALLQDLLERHEHDLPQVTGDEVQARFDAQRGYLEYGQATRTERWLQNLGISGDELEDQLIRHAALEKRVDLEISRLQSDPGLRSAVLWKMFMDMSLRARTLKAAAAELLAAYTDTPPDEPALEKVRASLKLAHKAQSWEEVEKRLVEDWGVPREKLSSLLQTYARAMTVER